MSTERRREVISGTSAQIALIILRKITIRGAELQDLPEERYVKSVYSLKSQTKKTVIPITVLKTALTPSLSLEIFFDKGKISKISILKKKEQKIIPEFLLYFLKEGDPLINLEYLDLKRINPKCIKVYLKLKEVASFGKIITYGELARLTDLHPRFVGYCMKINPFPVIIPCHRVISKRDLGGFNQGIEIKSELLKHEGLIL
ncbi:O-6-methylguanine-DNA-alkyltransferase [Aquifex aeolicus VF5]|uniref:Methylated-DNA--protein-cysteine methyltransferase n=1 Tax=Aquifex aeolicus (strain VF5) TaxID=224324 RepID=O67467_AQUAE|nr:O-6-methylguanine-DNA-alkyltransferase [Aquifex aeolicus VF5]